MRNSEKRKIADQYSAAMDVFEKNNGILRMSEAVRQGVPQHAIYSMLSDGILLREERGLYRLTSYEPLSNPDISKVGLLVPKAVICLISALYHYNLTTQIPYAVHIALPSNIQAPKIKYPPIDIVWLSVKAYSAGIEEVLIDGVRVKIYSQEKTIADCFKFRSKIGEDVALEALRDYLKQYRTNIPQLLEYARVNRVEKIIRPYLEALL